SGGITTNINAELQAILHSFQMAWNNGYRYVECESDCQSDLNFIQDEVHTTHLYAPVIDLIKRFIDYPWLLSFHHSLREGNSCAGRTGIGLHHSFALFCPAPEQKLSGICKALQL
ncbi:hypothetical protein L195_g059131, partial [Trifolium pratense]